jgi:hypothetical protein
MPKVKYREFVDTLRKASVFNSKVVAGVAGKGYSKLLLHNLRKRGEIIELIKGWYSFRKSPYLITIPLPESYIGLGSAAFIHGAWNTVASVNVLTTSAPRRLRTGERIIAGQKVIVRRISKKMYFGYELKYMEDAGGQIRVSDPEKTLIDMIYFNYPFRDEIFPELIKLCDKNKVKQYAELTSKKRVKSWKKIGAEVGRMFDNAA